MIETLSRPPWLVRLLLGAALGSLGALGFQPWGMWPMLLVSVLGFAALTMGAARWWQSLVLGYAWGLGFMGVGVSWMSAIFVEAAVGLVLVTAATYAAIGVGSWLVRDLRWWPVGFAAVWVGGEAVASRWPFGGFGWMRLGFAMIDSPLAGLYPVVGTVGVSFAAALVAVVGLWWSQTWRPRLLLAAVTLLVVLTLTAAGLLAVPGAASSPVSLGWVQGGAPGGGVFGIGPARTTTERHLAESLKLADRVAAGEVRAPEAVIWPENGTDLDAIGDTQTRAMVDRAVNALGVPILVGTILDGPGADERQTASLWWEPGEGETARYLKRGIVPFGEWVPLRSLLEPLIPQLVYVGRQSVAGSEPGVLDVEVASGPLRLGTLICYDLAFDEYAFDLVEGGAQVVLVQSSNAMYQGTHQIDQQFAISRVRAAELRREILVVTTSGVSGLINADGSVAWRVDDPGAASGVESLPRRTGLTTATWLAEWVELAAVALAVTSLLVAVAALGGRRLPRGWVIGQNG